MSQSKSLVEFQKLLIDGYHEAAAKEDLVYNHATAELAIQSASVAIFRILNQATDKQMGEFVRLIAASAPEEFP